MAVPPVKETRRSEFNDIVVKPGDVRALANVVVDVTNAQKKETSRVDCSFVAYAQGGRTYESDSPRLFDEDGPLDSKQVTSFHIEMWDFETGARIRMSLTHGGGEYGNFIEVSGRDSIGVNGTTRRLEEVIADFEKQAKWPRKYRPLFVIVGALGIGRIWFLFQDFLMDHIFHIQPISPRPQWLQTITPLLPMLIGLSFGSWELLPAFF